MNLFQKHKHKKEAILQICAWNKLKEAILQVRTQNKLF